MLAIGAASSERLEATSPSMATTLSREMSFLRHDAGFAGLDWSSSVMSSSCLPSTPPAALISSMAIRVPLWEDGAESGRAAGQRGDFADLDGVFVPRFAGRKTEGEDGGG